MTSPFPACRCGPCADSKPRRTSRIRCMPPALSHPCVWPSSGHASWCSPPAVVPPACMRRRRSYSFLASRMKSGLNDRRRLSTYSLGGNPRPVGAVGFPGMFGMVSFIAGTFLFAAGGVEHGPPVVARRPRRLFPQLVDQLWEPLVPDGRVSRIGRNHPMGLPPTLTGIQPRPRKVRPCRSGKPPVPVGGSWAGGIRTPRPPD